MSEEEGGGRNKEEGRLSKDAKPRRKEKHILREQLVITFIYRITEETGEIVRGKNGLCITCQPGEVREEERGGRGGGGGKEKWMIIIDAPGGRDGWTGKGFRSRRT